MQNRKRNTNLTPIPAGVEIGKPVSYYSNGWRFGTLVEISGNDAGIKTAGTYKHEEPTRLKWILVSDLKAVDRW